MLGGDHKNAPSELPWSRRSLTEQNGADTNNPSSKIRLNRRKKTRDRRGIHETSRKRRPPQRSRFQRGRWAANLGAKPEAIGKNAALRFGQGQREEQRNNDLDWDGDVEMQVAAKNLHAPGHPRSVLLVRRSKSVSCCSPQF